MTFLLQELVNQFRRPEPCAKERLYLLYCVQLPPLWIVQVICTPVYIVVLLECTPLTILIVEQDCL